MSYKNRYQNYGYPSLSTSTSTTSIASSCSASETDKRYQSTSALELHSSRTNGMKDSNGRSYRSRLEYIVSSMAYIRGELDDLKESDRVLLDIFKQLESNVEELSDSLNNWRTSGCFTPGRLASFSDLDVHSSSTNFTRRPPQLNYTGPESFGPGVGGVAYTMNSLETILDTSKEDMTSLKEENETDSGHVPESSSISCSPVLPSVPKLHHRSTPSIRSNGGAVASKRSSDVVPQMKLSTSFNRLANSPSISRLQDDGGSTMSRNSSIDSGIQFASEAENCSTNSVVEPSVSAAVDPSAEDVRKSVGFADDIFATLGFK